MSPRETMRVMTFNLLYETARHPAGGWTARRPLAADVIKNWAPDIVGVQEATATQCRHLAADLPDYCLISGPASGRSRLPVWAATVSPALATAGLVSLRLARVRHSRTLAGLAAGLVAGAVLPVAGTIGSLAQCGATTDEGEYCAILYHNTAWRMLDNDAFWLSGEPERPGSVLLGSWLPRVAHRLRLEHQASGDRFDFYNTHVDYLPWSTGRSGNILRNRLDNAWDAGTSQVLMGDFNAAPGSALYRHLTVHAANMPPLRDAWSLASHREGSVGTFHDGAGRVKWGGRIDHILARTVWRPVRVTTVTAAAGGCYPSDHFPVIAEYAKL